MTKKQEWICIQNQKQITCKNPTLESKHLSIHFFYVENESILIQTPNGKKILYDCGIESAAEEIHARLVTLGVQKIDVMIASHAHQDHAAGFYKLDKITNRAVTMGDLYDNGEDAINDTWFSKYRTFRDNLPDGGNYHKVAGRMKLSLDPDRKSTRLNSSHIQKSRMPSSA